MSSLFGKKSVLAILAFTLIISVMLAPGIINEILKNKIETKIDESLAQSISFDKMDVHHFDDEISFKNISLFSHSSGSKEVNFKAEELNLLVDFKDAINRNFQVDQIIAYGVTLNFNYRGKGQSNYHEIQDNFKSFVKSAKEKSSGEKTSWDIYNISMVNVSVNIYDSELGEIGTVHIPYLSLTAISSMYSKESNKDLLMAAVGKSILSHTMKGTLTGDYNKVKLLVFFKRELLNEAGKASGGLRQKMMAKAKEIALKLGSQ